MRRALRGSDGFTLAELLVVVAILGFITGAIFTLQRQGQLAYLTGAARVEVQQNARIALDTMISDLRLALPVSPNPPQVITAIAPNCTTGAPLPNSGATFIGFSGQRPPDAHDPVNYHGHAVTYQLNGTNLERTEDGTTEIVIGGVQQLQIWCYDDSGALNATLPRIREVRIQIRTQTERPAAAGSPGDQHAVVQSRVRFRNI